MFPFLQGLRAWAALVTFTATFGLGVVTVGHFGPEDDAACGQVAVGSGHPRVQFEAIKQSPPATHCPFCHWQRAVSGANSTALAADIFQLEPLDRMIPPGSRAARSAALDEQASRGPPAQI